MTTLTAATTTKEITHAIKAIDELPIDREGLVKIVRARSLRTGEVVALRFRFAEELGRGVVGAGWFVDAMQESHDASWTFVGTYVTALPCHSWQFRLSRKSRASVALQNATVYLMSKIQTGKEASVQWTLVQD